MMKIVVLASGSNGNSTYVETSSNKILIDDGISFKMLLTRAKEMNIDISNIDSVFLTHEHIDHISGLRMLAKNVKPICYLTQGTFDGMNKETKDVIVNIKHQFVKHGDVIYLGCAKITILQTHHDGKEPVGFVIEEGTKKLVYITDTGYVDQAYYPLISNANMYVMESNYDVELLWSSNRPFELKKRIDGDHGHMSNEASAVLLSNIIGANTKEVVLAHISDDCNYYDQPNLIIKSHQKVYKDYGLATDNIHFICGNRKGVTGAFEI